MDQALPLHLQEILFTGKSNSKADKQIRQLTKAGRLRRLLAGVYTPNLTELPEVLIRRHLFPILGHLFPGVLLSHRSALEFKPTNAGHLFLTHTYTKTVKWPGIILRFLQGPAPVKGDLPFMGGLMVSGKARALLENMQSARQAGDTAKVLAQEELEARLEAILRTNGEEELNAIRDEGREVANKLGYADEFKKLNNMIGALLQTKPSGLLTSPAALARALGEPYDTGRLDLFNQLFVTLSQHEFPHYRDRNRSQQAFQNFAFFEAYFSNYIEGTEFELEEALQIIESGQPIPGRREDSHDILGTYLLVNNREEMKLVPKSADDFLNVLRYRHKVLLSARGDKQPGAFKDRNNRAGETFFVDHKLVTGTLKKGFELYSALQHPFAKAAFMMFLVSEVHPFLDGNGRVARIMMNAELVAANQSRIIIPTVYREDYLGALRKGTRQQDTEPYIRMLQRIYAFSAHLKAEKRETLISQLHASHAFLEPEKGRLNF